MCDGAPWQCLLLHLPDSPKEGKTWKDALSICTSFESSLVTIEDEIEQGKHKKICSQAAEKTNATFPVDTSTPCAAFVTMLLQGSSVGVWIGLREGNSRWTSYSNWSPIEPRSYFTVRKRHRLIYMLEQLWNLFFCFTGRQNSKSKKTAQQ